MTQLLRLSAALTLLTWSTATRLTAAVPVEAHIVRHVRTLTATGPGAYEYSEDLEVTVFTSAAAKYFNEHHVYDDPFRRVVTLEGELVQGGGVKDISSKGRHRSTVAAYDGYSLAYDGKLEVLSLPLPEHYPATYRIRSLTRVKESIAMPVVSFRYRPRVSVALSELRLRGVTAEVLHQLLDEGGVIEQTRDSDGLVFRVSNLSAQANEDWAAPAEQVGPAVLLAPRRGRLEGTEGDFTTWAGLGAWTAALLAERSELPAAAKADIARLVAGVDDTDERIRRVYKYMQARTHYVSIQLGLGGFRPMPPTEVHVNGYGDCKALTNYTRLLLAEAGVESYYCIIGVSEREIAHPSFASVNQANHAMLAVPRGVDTTWLECTAQTVPANYISAGSAGRRALLIKEGTGVLVRTSPATAADNRRTSTATLTVDESGQIDYLRDSRFAGGEVSVPLSLNIGSQAERIQYWGRGYTATQVNLTEVTPSINISAAAPSGTLRERGSMPNYVRRIGPRMVIPAAAFVAGVDAPGDTLARALPICVADNFQRLDTLVYVLPKGVRIATAFAPLELSAPHATYRLSAKPTPTGAEVYRELIVHSGTYPAADAVPMSRFAAAVDRADRTVLLAAPHTPATAETN